ncbi:hypothetical protein DFH11DRAFT_756825 [Phellopilus nigrolimitatus]|nr:hypothetical protein DFH11DRAFT_756825 [Phellopilus nigrolimitatus]
MTHTDNASLGYAPMYAVTNFLAYRMAASDVPLWNDPDVWAVNGPFMRRYFEPSSRYQEILNVQDTVGMLKSAQKGLNSIHDFVQSGVSLLEKWLISGVRGRGVASLPDELVMHIFELSYELHKCDLEIAGEPSCDRGLGVFVHGLSSVNHRFRTLALNTPALWGRLSHFQRPENRNLYLARNKASGLTISIRSLRDESKGFFTDYIRDLLPHSRRWQTFTFECDAEKAAECLKMLRDSCLDMDLPSLHTLSLMWADDPDRENVVEDDAHFYSTWKIPNVKHLIVKNVIPRSCFGPSLVSCDLMFHGKDPDDTNETFDVEMLLDFLDTLRNLKYLKLFNCERFHEPTRELTVTLPALETLHVGFDVIKNWGREEHDGENVQNSVGMIMLSLHTPNITKLTYEVIFEEDWGGGMEELLANSYFYKKVKEYTALTDLTLHFENEGDTMPRLIDHIMKHCSKCPIEHMSIKALNRIPEWGRSAFRTNLPLRTLRFEGNAFDDELVWRFLDKDLALERLEIFGCPLLDDFALHKIQSALESDVQYIVS